MVFEACNDNLKALNNTILASMILAPVAAYSTALSAMSEKSVATIIVLIYYIV
jgi:hypothetical protein